MDEEIWREVPGIKHLFVSNLTRVKAGARKVVVTYSDPETGESSSTTITRVEQMLSPYKKPSGYVFVSFHHLNKKTEYRVHRLVALAFVDGYFPEASVDHIDCNKSNNHPSNLRWMTTAENTRREHTEGRYKASNHPFFKLPYEAHPEIFAKRASGMKVHEIAELYGVSKSLIGHVLTGHRKAR